MELIVSCKVKLKLNSSWKVKLVGDCKILAAMKVKTKWWIVSGKIVDRVKITSFKVKLKVKSTPISVLLEMPSKKQIEKAVLKEFHFS